MGFQRDKSLWRVKGSALAGMQGQRPCPAHLSLMQALRWVSPQARSILKTCAEQGFGFCVLYSCVQFERAAN